MLSRKDTKKQEIINNEKRLEAVSKQVNQIVGQALVDGGMLAEGRKRAATMLHRVEDLMDYSKKLMVKNRTFYNNIQYHRDRDLKFITGYDAYTSDLKIKIKSYEEDLELFLINARNAISNFKPKVLREEVNVQSGTSEWELYKYLFALLYNEDIRDFDWPLFKKIALDEESEDFQKRVAQLNVKDLTTEQAEEMKRIKKQDFTQWPAADNLIDLLTWMDWTYESWVLNATLEAKRTELAFADTQYDQKHVSIEAARKFMAHETTINKLFGDYLKQLENIKMKLINVLTSGSHGKDVDACYLELEAVKIEFEKLANVPAALHG